MSAFNTLFASNAGKQVTINDKATGLPKTYRISKLSEKLGTMKNGDKAAYVVLTAEDDTTIVISLHPQAASALFKKGEEAGMKITADAPKGWDKIEGGDEVNGDENAVMTAHQIEQDAAPVVETTEVVEVKADPVVEVKPETVTETTAEGNGEVAPAVKEPSKKEKTIAIVHAGWDAGKERKDIIAQLRTELNMGVPGANTYYQNVKSGAWGGRKN